MVSKVLEVLTSKISGVTLKFMLKNKWLSLKKLVSILNNGIKIKNQTNYRCDA